VAPLSLVVVVGMVREARIVAGEGLTVLIGGGQSARLVRNIEKAIVSGAAGLVSFGLCGALNPELEAGDIVVDSDDPEWLDQLRAAVPEAYAGRVLGGDEMIVSAREKTRLLHESGADVVDMESHVVTACAQKSGVPYAIVRSVSDAADRALPRAVMAGMKPDGETNLAGVLAALARRPWELSALLRTAREAQAAFDSLVRTRVALGARLAFPPIEDRR
jgi:adenosylhomocysteine nucleosidase